MTEYVAMTADGRPYLQNGAPVTMTQAEFEECCCEDEFTPSETECANCEGGAEGRTPAQLSVTFSGITICCVGVESVSSYSHAKLRGLDLNQTWTLDQDSDCIWRYTEELSGVYLDLFNNEDCTGDPAATEAVTDLEVHAQRWSNGDGRWLLEISLTLARVNLTIADTNAFQRQGEASEDCIAAVAMSDDHAAGDCDTKWGSPCAYGGSATLEAV